MSNFLTCICLVVLSLCDLLGSANGVWTDSVIHDKQEAEELVRRDDRRLSNMAEEPHNPFTTAIRSSQSSQRLASSRPMRLLPTYGGKPSNSHGRWSQDELSNHSKFFLLPQQGLRQSLASVLSPRKYYVIALRRLLC
ncbi:MAG: hypothetical protein J6N73_09290 [Prevotella sp.]|nr:hypothetical protein [Prevotella sp.]